MADKNATSTASPRQRDKVEVTALPPEIAVKQIKDSIDRTIMWCTVILTFVGSLGTWAAWKTLIAIKDQAETLHEHSEELRKLATAAGDNAVAAKETAEAARLNAQALMNSERAWVLVDIEWQQGPHIIEGSGTDGETTGIFVNYVCINEGRSFAQITEKGYVLKIANDLPKEPDFHHLDVFHHASEYVKPGDATEPYRLSGITCKGHRRADKVMVLYGRVKYRDVFGDHETHFGYLITGMGFLDRLPADGYSKYNKYT